MTRLLSVFVLFIIHPAELRPTFNDDLPIEEVFDYRLKNGYLNGRNTLKLRELMASDNANEESIKRNASPPIAPDANKSTKFLDGKDVFYRRRIKRKVFESQKRKNLSESTNLKADKTAIYTMENEGLDQIKTEEPFGITEIPRMTENSSLWSNLKEQTYKWTFDPDTTNNIHKPFFPEYIEFGMNMWAGVSRVNFKYLPWNRKHKYDIIVKFGRLQHGDNDPFDGKGGKTAHTKTPDEGDPYGSIEIHFDDDEDWKILVNHDHQPYGRTAQMPDFIQEVIHQTGHVIGFSHSKNTNSVMFKPLKKGDREGDSYRLSHEDKQNVKTQKGRCSPRRIHAAYSETYNGLTYMVVGPFTYEFDRRQREPYASVAKNWPRPSRFVWNGFELVDEIFIHTDDYTYLFSGDEYTVHISSPTGKKSPLPKMKLGKGISEDGKPYVGWPGLKHHNYIDAALRNASRTYIFQDDLVYLWDSEKKENDEFHFPKGGVADGWPRKIHEEFPGVPDNIDTAFRYYFDARIYFFKDEYFYAWSKEKQKAKHHKSIPDLWRNICNVYMCTSKDGPCRSWDLTREHCGSFCDS